MFRITVLTMVAFLMSGMLLVKDVAAQEATTYIITAAQPVNARECPRLNCAVVETVPPDTVINVVEVVAGDVVSGSNQWLRVNDQGVEMYIHSTLAIRSETPAVSVQDYELMSTVDWQRYEVGQSEFLMPPEWVSVEVLATDKGFLDRMAELYGEDEREWYLSLYESVQNERYDLVIVELSGSGVIFVSHFPFNRSADSDDLLMGIIENSLQINGFDVFSSTTLDLPGGTAVRVESSISHPDFHNESIVYGLQADNTTYLFELAVFGGRYMEYYRPLMYAVASSFIPIPANL